MNYKERLNRYNEERKARNRRERQASATSGIHQTNDFYSDGTFTSTSSDCGPSSDSGSSSSSADCGGGSYGE